MLGSNIATSLQLKSSCKPVIVELLEIASSVTRSIPALPPVPPDGVQGDDGSVPTSIYSIFVSDPALFVEVSSIAKRPVVL